RAIGGETTAWFTSSRREGPIESVVGIVRFRPRNRQETPIPLAKPPPKKRGKGTSKTRRQSPFFWGPYFMISLSGFTGNATARTRVTPGDRRRRSQRLTRASGTDSRLRISPRSLPRNRAASEGAALS